MPTKIDAPRAWGALVTGPKRKRLMNWAEMIASDITVDPECEAVRVRILRESDYRKLLKAARKGGMSV